MERKRVGRKFDGKTAEEQASESVAAEESEVEEEPEPAPAGKKPSLRASRLRYCRKLVSHKVAEAMPSIVDTLVDKAKKGSVAHTKEFLKLASIEQKKTTVEAPKRHGKGFAHLLLQELKSRQQGKEGPIESGTADGPAGG